MFEAKDYWERLNLQKLCSFLRVGVEEDLEEGTPKERIARYSKELIENLEDFRDQVIAFDWNSVSDDENKRYLASEEMWQGIMTTTADINRLEYEMGFHAALTILLEKEVNTDLRKALNI